MKTSLILIVLLVSSQQRTFQTVEEASQLDTTTYAPPSCPSDEDFSETINSVQGWYDLVTQDVSVVKADLEVLQQTRTKIEDIRDSIVTLDEAITDFVHTVQESAKHKAADDLRSSRKPKPQPHGDFHTEHHPAPETEVVHHDDTSVEKEHEDEAHHEEAHPNETEEDKEQNQVHQQEEQGDDIWGDGTQTQETQNVPVVEESVPVIDESIWDDGLKPTVQEEVQGEDNVENFAQIQSISEKTTNLIQTIKKITINPLMQQMQDLLSLSQQLESDLGIEDYHLRSIEKVRIANFIIEKLTTVIDPLSKLANDRDYVCDIKDRLKARLSELSSYRTTCHPEQVTDPVTETGNAQEVVEEPQEVGAEPELESVADNDDAEPETVEQHSEVDEWPTYEQTDDQSEDDPEAGAEPEAEASGEQAEAEASDVETEAEASGVEADTQAEETEGPSSPEEQAAQNDAETEQESVQAEPEDEPQEETQAEQEATQPEVEGEPEDQVNAQAEEVQADGEGEDEGETNEAEVAGDDEPEEVAEPPYVQSPEVSDEPLVTHDPTQQEDVSGQETQGEAAGDANGESEGNSEQTVFVQTHDNSIPLNFLRAAQINDESSFLETRSHIELSLDQSELDEAFNEHSGHNHLLQQDTHLKPQGVLGFMRKHQHRLRNRAL